MKKYTIALDKPEAEFYMRIASVAGRPIEDILSNTLEKVVELIARQMGDGVERE